MSIRMPRARLAAAPVAALFIAATALLPSMAAAQTTADAINQFEQLPESQQSALLDRLRGSQTQTAEPPADPDVVEPEDGTTSLSMDDNRGEAKTILGRDSLILTVRGGNTSNPLVEAMQGKQYLRTDERGRLDIYGIKHVILAGLTVKQAAARLEAEPLLQGANVSINLLPVKPFGANALQPFGYDLFSGSPSTFAPATRIPVPQDYVLGPGDTLNITLFGNINQTTMVAVDRNGDVSIPDLGVMNVSGRQFDDVRTDIANRVESKLIGTEVSVTLDQLRSVRVFVLGESANPGAYTVSSLSTLTHALYVSGGIKRTGSLRKVQLKRRGRVVRTLDLYDLLLDGDTRDDIKLKPDDVIFVPPVGKTAAVYGEVVRPAIYEFQGRARLDDLIRLAGGLTASAAGESVQVQRITENGTFEILEENASSAQIVVADGDRIEVTSRVATQNATVVVDGHAPNPGPRGWRAGLRVSDVLGSTARLLPKTDLQYALIVDPTAQRPPQAFAPRLALDPSRRNTIDDPIVPAGSRIVLFDRSAPRSALLQDLLEQANQNAEFGQLAQTVRVVGSVRFPGKYPRQPDMTVSQLILAAGDLTQDAYGLSADIIRRMVGATEVDQRIETVDLAAVLQGKTDPVLQPQDTLVIRQLPEWRESITVEIRGEVRFPGSYVVKEGDTVSDLVARAGGLTTRAYPDAAVFTRDSLRKREAQALEALRSRTMQQLSYLSVTRPEDSLNAGSGDLEIVRSILQESRETEVLGRLVIDLPDQLNGEASSPIRLQSGDSLVIPPPPTTITVIGEAQFPSSHVYRDGTDAYDYVRESGGVTQLGEKSDIYVIRANGRVERVRKGLFRSGIAAEPGDTVVVPLDLDRIEPIKFWSTITQILYQTALAVAAFNTVGAF